MFAIFAILRKNELEVLGALFDDGDLDGHSGLKRRKVSELRSL